MSNQGCENDDLYPKWFLFNLGEAIFYNIGLLLVMREAKIMILDSVK
jgi:hypothetical protein